MMRLGRILPNYEKMLVWLEFLRVTPDVRTFLFLLRRDSVSWRRYVPMRQRTQVSVNCVVMVDRLKLARLARVHFLVK